jgi:hypothetical protein
VDLIATWDWRAWSLLVPLVAVVGWFAYRWLAGLAFRYLLVNGVARRHGWQADVSAGRGARARFDEQERRRRGKAWTYLRQGRLREGYRNGVFGRSHSGAWHAELTLTGTWRGRPFSASQLRRYEMTSGHENVRRKVRRRSWVQVSGTFPVFEARVSRLGRVQAPPEVAELVRARRWRFRGFRADGTGLSMDLAPRLRRGRLLAALNYLNDVADRLG